MANVPRNSWGDPIKPTAASPSGEAVWGDAEAAPVGAGAGQSVPVGTFTPRELEALRDLKQSADKWRSIGFVVGCIGAVAVMRRRKSPHGPLTRTLISITAGFGTSVVGSLANVTFNAPKVINSVEDPHHMAETMAQRRNAALEYYQNKERNSKMLPPPPTPNLRREDQQGSAGQPRGAWNLPEGPGGPGGPRSGQPQGGADGPVTGGLRDVGTGSPERPWGEALPSSPSPSPSSPAANPGPYSSRVPTRAPSSPETASQATQSSDPFAIPPSHDGSAAKSSEGGRASRWAQLRSGTGTGNGVARSSAPEPDAQGAPQNASAGASGSAWERLRRGEGAANTAGGPEGGIKESW